MVHLDGERAPDRSPSTANQPTKSPPSHKGSWADVRDALKAKAESLGFARVGITTPQPADRLEAYKAWVAEGKHGEMG